VNNLFEKNRLDRSLEFASFQGMLQCTLVFSLSKQSLGQLAMSISSAGIQFENLYVRSNRSRSVSDFLINQATLEESVCL